MSNRAKDIVYLVAAGIGTAIATASVYIAGCQADFDHKWHLEMFMGAGRNAASRPSPAIVVKPENLMAIAIWFWLFFALAVIFGTPWPLPDNMPKIPSWLGWLMLLLLIFLLGLDQFGGPIRGNPPSR